ncbi:MAG: DUF308 domain-containing protein [Bacteroidales bacterium]|nr:DUF308 domain-containing protein [Bacteroidales bacterium]
MKKTNWIIFLVNGVIAILFGLLALLVPAETIVSLTIYFGLLILLGGLILFYFSYKNLRAEKPYLLLMAEAILAILIGAVIVFYPKSSLQIFLIMIGIWATIMGLLQIIIAVQMKGKVRNSSLFTLNGVITLVFGLLLFFNPMGAIEALFIVIGLLALIAGLLLVYLAFKIRGSVQKVNG